MGGKGGSAPVPIPQVHDNTAELQMLMAMMSSLTPREEDIQSQPQELNQQYPIPPAPEIEKPVHRDWKKEYDKIKAKTAADYLMEQRRQYGRLDTIHTSPLLDSKDNDDILALVTQ